MPINWNPLRSCLWANKQFRWNTQDAERFPPLRMWTRTNGPKHHIDIFFGTFVYVIVILILISVSTCLIRSNLHHCMHSKNWLSSSECGKSTILCVDLVFFGYSILSFSTEVTIGCDVSNGRITLWNSSCKSLLLPCILLWYILYTRKAKHGPSIFQELTTKKVDSWTRIHVYKVGVISDLMIVYTQLIQWIRSIPSLHVT